MTETRQGADALTLTTRLGQEVGGLFVRPDDAVALLVLAHGAGAGMRHPFMEAVADRLADRGVATLRYQFPYMEAGRRGPDRPPKLVATVDAALARGAELAEGLPVFAGGKSMGGRMTSTAAAEGGWEAEPPNDEPGVRGVVFFGFPLHPPGRPGTERGAHLEQVRVPLLFLQGSRDAFATPELLTPVLSGLTGATLHVVEGADHGFHVRKSSGRSDADVLDELADVTADWMRERLGG